MVPYRSVLYMKDQRMIFESRKNVDLMNEDCSLNTPVHFMLPVTVLLFMHASCKTF